MSEIVSHYETPEPQRSDSEKSRILGGKALEPTGFEIPSIDAESRIIIAPGSVATLDHGDEVVRYKLLGEGIEDDVDEDVMSVSPTSPLGQRLPGATVGVIVSWNTPRGPTSATIIAVTTPQ